LAKLVFERSQPWWATTSTTLKQELCGENKMFNSLLKFPLGYNKVLTQLPSIKPIYWPGAEISNHRRACTQALLPYIKPELYTRTCYCFAFVI